MGSFSWLYADKNLEYNNICESDKYKMLIPEEFGGGEIIDDYQDYGHITTPWGDTNIYHIIAFMNLDAAVDGKPLRDILAYKGIDHFPHTIEEIVKYGCDARHYGIEIACYDADMNRLTFPLKLVSEKFKGTYEDCDSISFSDPNQGFFHTYHDHREELEDSIDYDDDDWMYDDDDDFDDCEYDDYTEDGCEE